MLMVYVASPITKPDPISNAMIAIAVGDELMAFGMCPFLPQLSYFQQKYGRYYAEDYGEDYELFMKIDFEVLSRCDVLLRLPGFSLGADREVEYALSLDKIVFYDIDTLIRYKETIWDNTTT